MSRINTFHRVNTNALACVSAHEMKPFYNFSKYCLYNLLLLAIICIFATPTTMALAAEQQETILSGKILPKLIAQPYLPFISIIEEILVEPGQAVKKDQPIISYKLNPEALRAIQREILFGANTEELKAQILDATQKLSTLSEERNKTRELVNANLAADRALIDIENSINHQRNKISLLRTTLNKQTDNFKIRLKELSGYFDGQITTIDNLPKTLYLKSLIDGNILSIAPNLYSGTQEEAGFVPFQIANLDTMVIIVQVYETELNTIKVGDTAKVVVPSLQDKEFIATVSRVAWVSSDLDVANPSFFTIELEISNPNLELRPGFKAIVHFE